MTRPPSVKLVSVKKLTPAPWNPRTISKERFENLCAALKRDPEMLWARPILAMEDGVVFAGNMRLRAAIANGMTSVPAIVESITLEQAKERALRDNGAWGEWAEQDLAEMLAKMDPAAAALVGFDEGELERLLASVGIGDVTDDDDFDPTPPTVATAATGDVYMLGEHRLVVGDARDEATWRLLMGEEQGDCMWTDPPYGIDLQVRDSSRAAFHGKKGRDWTTGTDAFKGDKLEDLRPLLNAVFPNVNAHLKPGGPWYIAGPHGGVQHEIFIEAVLAVRWHHVQTLVWVKNAFVPGRHDYHSQHEAILYGWKPGAAHIWNLRGDRGTVIE